MTAPKLLMDPPDLSTERPPRHVLEMDPETQRPSSDKTLCGIPWDAYNVTATGKLCKDCMKILRERGHSL